MTVKTTFFSIAAAAALFACTKHPQSIALFNGKDLSGWTAVLEDSSRDASQEFTASDGVISLSGSFGYIRTEVPYANYKLSADWRWPDSAANSGIFVQLREDGIWPNCYECQLWAGNAGDIIHSGGTTSNELKADTTRIILPKLAPSSEKPVGEWNTAEIVCADSTVSVFINGELQNEITGISNRNGYIGLQSEGGPVQFRNVSIVPLK